MASPTSMHLILKSIGNATSKMPVPCSIGAPPKSSSGSARMSEVACRRTHDTGEPDAAGPTAPPPPQRQAAWSRVRTLSSSGTWYSRCSSVNVFSASFSSSGLPMRSARYFWLRVSPERAQRQRNASSLPRHHQPLPRPHCAICAPTGAADGTGNAQERVVFVGHLLLRGAGERAA